MKFDSLEKKDLYGTLVCCLLKLKSSVFLNPQGPVGDLGSIGDDGDTGSSGESGDMVGVTGDLNKHVVM